MHVWCRTACWTTASCAVGARLHVDSSCIGCTAAVVCSQNYAAHPFVAADTEYAHASMPHDGHCICTAALAGCSGLIMYDRDRECPQLHLLPLSIRAADACLDVNFARHYMRLTSQHLACQLGSACQPTLCLCRRLTPM